MSTNLRKLVTELQSPLQQKYSIALVTGIEPNTQRTFAIKYLVNDKTFIPDFNFVSYLVFDEKSNWLAILAESLLYQIKQLD